MQHCLSILNTQRQQLRVTTIDLLERALKLGASDWTSCVVQGIKNELKSYVRFAIGIKKVGMRTIIGCSLFLSPVIIEQKWHLGYFWYVNTLRWFAQDNQNKNFGDSLFSGDYLIKPVIFNSCSLVLHSSNYIISPFQNMSGPIMLLGGKQKYCVLFLSHHTRV